MSKAVLFSLFVLPAVLLAQPPPNPETERLIATGKLWATVKYFHPYLAYRDIDWDKALIDALPKIRSAQTSPEYQTGLRTMLDALHDPATYALLDTTTKRSTASLSSAAIHVEKRPDGTVIVSQLESSEQTRNPLPELAQSISSARRLLFDLRVEPGDPQLLSQLLEDQSITKLLTRTAVETAPQRSWLHNGLPAEFKVEPDNGFYTAFLTRPGRRFEGNTSAQDLPLAFLLNENAPLPYIGSALLARGKAKVLAESSHFEFSDVASAVIPMSQGVIAKVRLSESVVASPVKAVSHEAALEQALSSFAQAETPAVQSTLPAVPSPRLDLAYNDMHYPAAEYRILAAYKTWTVLRNFFAYRDLMDEDWDEVFGVFLPRLIAAKNAREYNLTLAEMVTRAADSHAFIESADMTDYFGEAPAGLRVRLIEKKPVITDVLDPEAAKAGVHAGDVITRVDGESITERFHREARYLAASTQQALGYAVMQQILKGPEGSDAVLTIQEQNGQTREARLKRSSTYLPELEKQRSGDVIKVLPGNIGYVDLDRLLPAQVELMFDNLRSTQAIVFDMRGSPHGTAASIAPRLTEHQDVAAALYNAPLSLTPDLPFGELSSSASYFFVQKLPPTDRWKYKGKTVMLIDERTRGEAEHTGLFFEAANRTEFIGSQSAGADSDVTNFVVPGGITVWFSGRDIRHANGGALQRLGLQPAIGIAPTIDGVRKDIDEVLQKAIEYLSPASQKASLAPATSACDRDFCS